MALALSEKNKPWETEYPGLSDPYEAKVVFERAEPVFFLLNWYQMLKR